MKKLSRTEVIMRGNSPWTLIGEEDIPVGVPLILTVDDVFRQKRELRYPVYYRRSCYSEEYGFYVYGAENEVLLEEYTKVVAWMPMPSVWME